MSDDFRGAWEGALSLYRAKSAENERLRSALKNARSSLIAFGGDPRQIHLEGDGRLGDAIQVVLLMEIDAALSPPPLNPKGEA